jgi:hypothetical protein
MASGLNTPERRRTARLDPEFTQWREVAILRPGQEVLLINVGAGGALLESCARMAPGARGELQLFGARRRLVRGRIGRCHVTQLNPLAYRGAFVFDEPLDVTPRNAG